MEFDAFLKKATKIGMDVGQNLQHIHLGGHSWSPEWQKARDTKKLWCQILKHRQKRTTTMQMTVPVDPN